MKHEKDPPKHCDRRAFLRTAGGVLLLGGCTFAERSGNGDDGDDATSSRRPNLLPWTDDAVRIAAPARERPVLYLSMERYEIYVDLAFRERLHPALRAHISVSTEHWRVPLPGDDLSIPIDPGDSSREFEELDIWDWDGNMVPSEGDIRVFRGSPVPDTLELACAPLSGGESWFSGGPWSLQRHGPASDALCREDFFEIGTGPRYQDRDCTRPSGTVRYLTWAVRPGISLEGV